MRWGSRLIAEISACRPRSWSPCAEFRNGTLRRAATYPEPADSKGIEEVAEALKRVGLKHLIDRLEEEAPWDQTLSGGEKQRLAFARILLQRPDIVVLDEATSALDPDSQDKLMELLTTELDATTIVSVGHRPELEAFPFLTLSFLFLSSAPPLLYMPQGCVSAPERGGAPSSDAVQIWLSSQEGLKLNFSWFNRGCHFGPKLPCFPVEFVLRIRWTSLSQPTFNGALDAIPLATFQNDPLPIAKAHGLIL